MHYIFYLRMENIPTQEQHNYLSDLLKKQSSSLLKISNFMEEVHDEFQRQIEQGNFDIKRRSYSLNMRQSLKKHSIITGNLLQHRQSLQGRLKVVDAEMKDLPSQKIVTDQDRLKFVKQMKKQQEELQRKRQQLIQAENMKKDMKRIEEKQRKQREQQLKKQMKRINIERRLQQLEEEKQIRESQIKERNRQYQQIKKEKTLLHKMQQNYIKNQNQSLEEKKKKLAHIRELHRPMNSQEFQQHLSRIKQYQAIKQQEKQMIQGDKRPSESSVNIFYQSHWYKNILKEEKIDQSRILQEEKQFIRLLKEREKKYCEYIKQNFTPDSDEKLIEELAKRQSKSIPKKKAKEIRQMGLNNLKYSKQKIISKQEFETRKQEEANKPLTTCQKPKDYLKQLKNHRKSLSLQENFLQGGKERSFKAQTVKKYAQRLEQQARRQQQLQKVRKSLVGNEADEMYMKALNAKLNLLKK